MRPAEEPLPPDARPAPVSDPVALPRFNWGAFLIAPLWGVSHGQWAGVFFLPTWAFVDNLLRGDGLPPGVLPRLLGAAMAAVTLGLQAFYARNANRVARLRGGERFDAQAYLRRQRTWAWAGVLVLLAMIAWIGTYLATQAPA